MKKKQILHESLLEERKNLIKLGLIIEDNNNWDTSDPAEIEFAKDNAETQIGSNYPDADYALQDELIRFFANNEEITPDMFRQFAASLGIEPDALHYQENILLGQLVKIYTADSNDLGYGDALTSDEVDPEILSSMGVE